MKSWFGYGLHQVRDPGGFQRHPGIENRDQRAERGQAGNVAAALQGLHRGPGTRQRAGKAVGPVRPVARASREEKNDPDKPLFDDNVHQRGEVLVLKPALSGTGFEADRGACGTLKYRCPAAAFGCAGRKECCRARQAGEPSASTSMTVGFSRRPLGQPLLEAGTAVPPRSYSRVDNACGEALPAAPAARPRDGGGDGARLPAGGTSGRSLVGPVALRDGPRRSSDRPPETGCLRSGRGSPRVLRRSVAAIFSLCSEI